MSDLSVDDGSSNAPGTVRRKPSGKYLAVRIEQPAAWIVVSVLTGGTMMVPIADWRAGDIYEKWPVI